MSNLTYDYRSDVNQSIASLDQQLERTRTYVRQMYTGAAAGAYTRDLLTGLIDGFTEEVLKPFAKALQASEADLQIMYERVQLLTVEWDRISQIIYLARTNYKDVEFFTPVIAEVKRLAGIENFILPCTAGPFSITSFQYLENLNVLNIPVTAAYSPWEWSVFWHEIAGILAEKNAEEISDAYYSIKSQLDPATNWSREWFEELYEDAFSVLSFGKPFIEILQRILSRTAIRMDGDKTHPPLTVRLNVAHRLFELFENQSGDIPQNENKKSPEEIVANQLLKLLPGVKFRPIRQKPGDWPITNKILEIMTQYIENPGQGQELFSQMKEFISDNAFNFNDVKVSIVQREVNPEVLISGNLQENDQIVSWRGHQARLTLTGQSILAHNYKVVSGVGGGNATRNSDGALIYATWYRLVSG